MFAVPSSTTSKHLLSVGEYLATYDICLPVEHFLMLNNTANMMIHISKSAHKASFVCLQLACMQSPSKYI